MTVSGRTIAANTTLYAAALTIQKIISFVYFSFLARSLGAEATGQYVFALSIAAIIMVFMDLGLAQVITREGARDEGRLRQLLRNIMGLKLIMIFLVVVVGSYVIPYATSDTTLQTLLFVSLAIAVFDSTSLGLYAGIRSRQNLFYESISSVAFQIITLALGGAAIIFGAPITVILASLAVASFIHMCVAISVLGFKYDAFPFPSFDRETIRELVVLSAPFALAALFLKVQAYIDTVLLKAFLDDAAVGIYSVPYKLTFAFQFIPLAFIAALYPAFSHYWNFDREKLATTFAIAGEYLLMLALPITIGTAVIAPAVIPVIYTDVYRASVLPLIVLISSLPFLFIAFPAGALLNACGRQTRQTVHLGVVMAVTVVLNIALIPLYGPLGAAIASTVSTVVMFGLGIWVAHQIVPSAIVLLFRRGFYIVVSAGVMGLSVYAATFVMPWYASVVIGFIAYPLMLIGTKTVTLSDISSMRSLLRR